MISKMICDFLTLICTMENYDSFQPQQFEVQGITGEKKSTSSSVGLFPYYRLPLAITT